MGCRCQERAEALAQTGTALSRGDLARARRQAAFVVRSFAQDLRSGAVKREVLNRLALGRLSR